MKKTLFAFFLILVIYLATSAQQMDFHDFKVMNTGKGIILMNKSGSQDFAFLIEGGDKAIQREIEKGLLVKSKSGSIYAYTASLKSFKFSAKKPTEEFLKAVMNWEKENLGGIRGQKEKIDFERIGFLPVHDLRKGETNKVNLLSLIWSFAPASPKSERRLYQAVVIGDSFLMLRKDFPAGTKVEEVVKTFKYDLESITLLPSQNPLTQNGNRLNRLKKKV